MTSWPSSAKATASGRPTYPRPTTPMLDFMRRQCREAPCAPRENPCDDSACIAMNATDSNDAHQPVPRVPGTDKRALITGISGQDGSYLAELLLDKGYEVHGIVRRSSSFNTDRIDHLYHDPHESGVRMFTHYGDLTDAVALVKLLYELQPDEIYHLGAQSHV